MPELIDKVPKKVDEGTTETHFEVCERNKHGFVCPVYKIKKPGDSENWRRMEFWKFQIHHNRAHFRLAQKIPNALLSKTTYGTLSLFAPYAVAEKQLSLLD